MSALLKFCFVLFGLIGLCKLSSAQMQSDAAVLNNSMQKIEVQVGSGAEVKTGNTVVVHYTGWLYDPLAVREHGAKFDSSVGGPPFTFQVGAGRVIKGWDLGLVGMRVGGKRTLIIPPELAYGRRGSGMQIGPNAELVFDIELIGIK